jgi:hypothetical protein
MDVPINLTDCMPEAGGMAPRVALVTGMTALDALDVIAAGYVSRQATSNANERRHGRRAERIQELSAIRALLVDAGVTAGAITRTLSPAHAAMERVIFELTKIGEGDKAAVEAALRTIPIADVGPLGYLTSLVDKAETAFFTPKLRTRLQGSWLGHILSGDGKRFAIEFAQSRDDGSGGVEPLPAHEFPKDAARAIKSGDVIGGRGTTYLYLWFEGENGHIAEVSQGGYKLLGKTGLDFVEQELRTAGLRS